MSLPRRNNQSKFSNFLEKKIPIEDLPVKTMKVTIHALKWVFLLIALFVIIGMLVLFLTGGGEYLQLIVGYSITGFFTFFMGYFGWVLAQSVIETLIGHDVSNEENVSYYISKNRNKRY